MASNSETTVVQTIHFAGILTLVLKRVLASIATLAALIFFVAVAVSLSARGGISALPQVLPDALQFSLSFITGIAGGQLAGVEELRGLLARSLGLLLAALMLALMLGLPLGALAAVYRHRRFARGFLFVSFLGISMPSFFAAMLLIWLNVWVGRLLGIHILPVYGFGWDAHMIIPTLVLAAIPTANIARLGYNALFDVLESDFIRTAHSKGLRPHRVFLVHAMRAAGVPLLTIIGVSIRLSLSILPVVEYIFNWRGLGLVLLQSIQTSNATMAVTTLLPLALTFMLVNILLELLYATVDPRVRLEVGGTA